MNIVMPMAGKGTRLAKGEYGVPKPLVKVLGKTLIEWSVETLGLEGNYIFCCQKEHIEKYNIDKKLKEIIPDCQIVSMDFQTRGPVESILEATHLIDNDEELIISDTDHYLIWDKKIFNEKIRTQNIDACVMVFPDEWNSSVASYVKLNNEGFVIEAAEKIPISKTATVGLHYYKHGSDFVRFANETINLGLSYKNEFYVTPAYNQFVKAEKKIITFPVTKMWALGSPSELSLFVKEYSK